MTAMEQGKELYKYGINLGKKVGLFGKWIVFIRYHTSQSLGMAAVPLL